MQLAEHVWSSYCTVPTKRGLEWGSDRDMAIAWYLTTLNTSAGGREEGDVSVRGAGGNSGGW